MKLLTKSLEKKLLKNGQVRDADMAPVVKFFNPCGGQTWLISEMESDGDTMFGLCDLGFGFPELGYVSLSELAAIRTKPFGLGIERDRAFETKLPMSDFVAKANKAERITA